MKVQSFPPWGVNLVTETGAHNGLWRVDHLHWNKDHWIVLRLPGSEFPMNSTRFYFWNPKGQEGIL